MQRYSEEFKARAVDLYNQGGITYDQLADDLDVSRASLSAWIKQAKNGGVRPIDEAEAEELRRLRKENAILKEEREILKKSNNLLRSGVYAKKVVFDFIDSEKSNHGIALLCKVLKVSRSGYYAHMNREISNHDITDELLKSEIMDTYEANRCVYGVPRIIACLKRKGTCISKDRCSRLMRELGIEGVSKRRKRPKSRPSEPETASPGDLVCRDFSAKRPNEVWFADITYVKTYQGWLYLAIVFDIFSRMVVGWSMGQNMHASLVDDALLMAVMRRRPGKRTIHHSDHGSQYRSVLLGKTMRKYGIRPSMGGHRKPVGQRSYRVADVDD